MVDVMLIGFGESLSGIFLALAAVDMSDKMIGENLLDVVEKKDDNRPNEAFTRISESRFAGPASIQSKTNEVLPL